jgi:TolB protein
VLELERRGSRFTMSVAGFGNAYSKIEDTTSSLPDEVYVGMFVCAHNPNLIERARFENVRVIVPARQDFVPYHDYIGSHIELLTVENGQRQIIYSDAASFQAPNWSRDGRSLFYNSNGKMFRLTIGAGTVSPLVTGNITTNNNDHVLSFNGQMMGLSAASPDGKYNSVVYTVPVSGGLPTQITPVGPSYLHGWSPDGKWLVFTGQRNGEFDIYKIPVSGGKEVRLTSAPGLDDGPEFSPDGRHIYFNSVRSGTMQIWRMNPDGSGQTQITDDRYNNWFPHVSPDGKWLAFVTFDKDVRPDDHPFYRHVYLRIMAVNGGAPKVIAYVYGGQGSMNTPSWSPDSKRIAFVSNSDTLK